MSLLERSSARTLTKGESQSFLQFKELFEQALDARDIARLREKSLKLARQEVESCARRLLWQHKEEFPPELHDEYVKQLKSSIFGFGALDKLLADPQVTEIMLNGLQSMYCEEAGVLKRLENPFSSEAEILDLIDRIISPLNRRLDESSPAVNARLPEGYRVHAIIPPLSLVGPVLTIRKFPESCFSLNDLERLGSIDMSLRQLLIWAVRMRKNIAVTGGTGSGKTSLLNALSVEIKSQERILTIEDSAELRFESHPHVVRLEARAANSEGKGEVSIRDLVIHALRMRPDRIIVGECRGAEAIDMLQAMNTGHDGSLTTLHANSPQEAIMRLVTMVRYASELPVDVIKTQIGSAIQLMVQLVRLPSGQRMVSQICELKPDKNGLGCLVEVLYERNVYSLESCWKKAPSWLPDLSASGIASREEVRLWCSACSLPF